MFYTLMVLSIALFGKPAFQNLICNGLVLADDGKKMSKSLKNYPSPMEIIDQYGADAVRLYLINSPIVRAEPLCFKKEGVYSVVVPYLLKFLDNLTNIYVRCNCKRLKGRTGEEDCRVALSTFYNITNLCFKSSGLWHELPVLLHWQVDFILKMYNFVSC